MILTALFNKLKSRDLTVMPAGEVLRIAMIEGAQAFGLKTRLRKSEKTSEVWIGRSRAPRRPD